MNKVGIILTFLILVISCTRENNHTYYWDNGKLRETIKKGVSSKVDTLLNYDEQGRKVRVAQLISDSLNGESIYYYSNGKLHMKETYRNGKRDGDAFRYDSLGKIINHIYYKTDSPIYIANYNDLGEIYLLQMLDTTIYYNYIPDSVAREYYNSVVTDMN